LDNFFDIKFDLWNKHNVDPEWVEKLPFYEYQLWIEKINESTEDKNKKNTEKSGKKEAFSFGR